MIARRILSKFIRLSNRDNEAYIKEQYFMNELIDIKGAVNWAE